MKRILILLTFLCAFIMTTSVLAYTPPFHPDEFRAHTERFVKLISMLG